MNRYKVVRYYKEEYEVYATSREEALNYAKSPSAVTIQKETVTCLERNIENVE